MKEEKAKYMNLRNIRNIVHDAMKKLNETNLVERNELRFQL